MIRATFEKRMSPVESACCEGVVYRQEWVKTRYDSKQDSKEAFATMAREWDASSERTTLPTKGRGTTCTCTVEVGEKEDKLTKFVFTSKDFGKWEELIRNIDYLVDYEYVIWRAVEKLDRARGEAWVEFEDKMKTAGGLEQEIKEEKRDEEMQENDDPDWDAHLAAQEWKYQIGEWRYDEENSAWLDESQWDYDDDVPY